MDIYDVMRLLENVGFKVSRNKSTRHWRATSPSGTVFGHSGSPSDWRAIKNFRSDLRRAGYDTHILKAQYERAVIEERAIRNQAAQGEQYDKIIVVRVTPVNATPAKKSKTEAELRAHREEMRKLRQ